MNEIGIEGYASLFFKRDLNNDIVAKGAFRNSLLNSPKAGVKMLYQHQSLSPIGLWDEIYEDEIGLFVRGRIIDFGSEARMVMSLVKHAVLDGLSIGFQTVKAGASDYGRIRILKEVELWEISLVTFPMLTGARFKVSPSYTAKRVMDKCA